MRAVTFDWLARGDGAEDDFGGLTAIEGVVSDATAGGDVSPANIQDPYLNGGMYPSTSKGCFSRHTNASFHTQAGFLEYYPEFSEDDG